MPRLLPLQSAVVLALLVSGAGAETLEHPNVKLSLDWAFQGPESVFTLPADRGYYKAEGLNVTIDRGTGSTETVLRVASGAYDFGWADISSMIQYNAENPGKALIAVYVTGDNSPLAVLSVAGRGIAKPKDLEGRTLGAAAGSSARALFDAFADGAGIDKAKVAWKTMSGQLREPMLVRGEVDAVAGFTTSSILSIRDLGVKQGDIVVMPYNDYGLNLYGTAVWTTPAFAKANPKTVAAMVRAINKGLKDAVADPKAAVASLTSRDALVKLDTECERLADGLSTLTLTPHFKAEGIGTVEPQRMKASIDVILAAYNIKAEVPVSAVYSDAFLPPKAERMPPPLGACAK
jgi:NitT/TauT family transport system substrate-binding protein